jgi:hypothetical protein
MTTVSEAWQQLHGREMTVTEGLHELRSADDDLDPDDDDLDDDPDGDEDDNENWSRGYNYTDGLGINDGDDSIDGIGEQPSGLGDYCEFCGEFECDCAGTDAIGGPAVPYSTPIVQVF